MEHVFLLILALHRNAKLAALKEATSPGGQYYDSEIALGESMKVWQELFKAASVAIQ